PKPAAAPQAPEPEADEELDRPAPIPLVKESAPPSEKQPAAPAPKEPIAMPEVAQSDEPQVDPAPSIILNDIFDDEPDTPGTATPTPEDGPRLDSLMDEGPRPSSAGGNGLS